MVRKGNHPFKAVPGIQSQRNTLYPAWGIPLSLHLLERPIIIFRFSDHIGSVRTPSTLNLTKTMMNRHPHLPYGGDGCYPRNMRLTGQTENNGLYNVQPIILFIRNLTFALAGRASLTRKSAPVLASIECGILIPRKYLPAGLRHFCGHPSVDVEGSRLLHSRSVAVRADDHLNGLATTRAVVGIVTSTY